MVGGPGADILDDSACGHTRFYDHEGENRLVPGPGTEESNKPYAHPVDRAKYPLRDWGDATIPRARIIAAGGDLGLFLGLEPRVLPLRVPASTPTRRGSPCAAATRPRSTGFRLEYEGEFAHTNSRKARRLFARVSNIEIVRFHGFGNETVGRGGRRFLPHAAARSTC